MKKFLIVLALYLVAVSPAFASGNEKVNSIASDRFKSDFKGADGLWESHNTYDEVLYFWHSTLMQSCYNKNGELIGTFHHVEVASLPDAGLRTLLSSYKGYRLKETVLMEKPGESNVYYATLTGVSKIITVAISLEGDVSVVDVQK